MNIANVLMGFVVLYESSAINYNAHAFSIQVFLWMENVTVFVTSSLCHHNENPKCTSIIPWDDLDLNPFDA